MGSLLLFLTHELVVLCVGFIMGVTSANTRVQQGRRRITGIFGKRCITQWAIEADTATDADTFVWNVSKQWPEDSMPAKLGDVRTRWTTNSEGVL